MIAGDQNWKFMERVVVWPGAAEAPGWINLHSHWRNDTGKNGGKPFVVGWPFKTLNEFMTRAGKIENDFATYDAWFCLSQQSECGVNTKGRAKAVRLAKNATWLKAIWLDIDVKPMPGDWDQSQPWGHYQSIGEAWLAISAFRQKTGLPAPSNVVKSGGGLHVYWISETPLSPADWRPYAEGLKSLALQEGLLCDAGLTTDNVRILRVPGTLNHKYDPPRAVEVIGEVGPLYDFSSVISFLKKFNPERIINATDNFKAELSHVIDPGFDLSGPDPAFASLSPTSTDLGGPSGPKLLRPTGMFQQCGFLRDALRTGGEHHGNPLWNLSLLCATFMEDGNAFAHALSKKHPAYSEAETDAQFNRKMVERTERGIGYPSCATIQSNGSKHCAGCPLLPKGKSPLNIKPPFVAAPITAAVNLPPQSATSLALNLPEGYEVLGDGCIYEIEMKETKKGELYPVQHRLFYSRLDMPWVQKDPDVIHVRSSYDKGNTVQTMMKAEDWSGPGFEKKFTLAKIKYFPRNKLRLEHFLMSWIAKMHEAAEASTALAFGWYYEGGDIKGFAYGGFIHMDTGLSRQAGLTDRASQAHYNPTGESAKWATACNYLLMQQRPDLEIILASSFAGPLMPLTGTTGAMMSSWSIDSGVGKSYALELGAGIWGHPKLTRETSSSSWKNVEKRLGSTTNLPLYWDEIHDDKARKNVYEMTMVTTGGVSGGKLKSNREFADRGTWSTLLIINSNSCFKDYVRKHQPTHVAGLNRVFEMQLFKPAPGTEVGQVLQSTAEQALVETQHNFGHVGLEYARLLGKDHVAIKDRINEVLKELAVELKPTNDDRFYVGTAAALIVGAELANAVGVKINVPVMREYLVEQIDINRTNRASHAASSAAGQFMGSDLISGYRQRNLMSTVWVDAALPNRPGKVPMLPFRRVNPNAPINDGVTIRYDSVEGTIAVSKKKFLAYCGDASINGGGGISESMVYQSLESIYPGIKTLRKTLGAGTPFSAGQEWAYVIPVAGFEDLEEGMQSQGALENQALGISTGTNSVDTGFITEEDGNAVDAGFIVSRQPTPQNPADHQ